MNKRIQKFEATFRPHLGAAYNLTRWLVRDASEVEHVIQGAYLNAFRIFSMIEILTMPRRDQNWVWSRKRSGGFSIVIELDDVDFMNRSLKKNF